MMKRILLLTAMLAIPALAQEPRYEGRLNVLGEKTGVKLTPGEIAGEHGTIMNFTWEKDPEKAMRSLTAIFPATDDWKRGVVSFTPDKSGRITLQFIGAHHGNGMQTWTVFDGIELQGATLENGSFEEGVNGWGFGVSNGMKAALSGDAKDGMQSAKASHDCGLFQGIAVTAGRKVTVAYWFKAAK